MKKIIGLYLLLIIYVFLIAWFSIKGIEEWIIGSKLKFAIYTFLIGLIIFLWYKYYKTEIFPKIKQINSLFLNTFSLVFGGAYGVIFTEIIYKKMLVSLQFNNMNNMFILAFLSFAPAFIIALYINILYGIRFIKD